jgi:methyl coenzyme M reductase subunit D
MTVSSTNTRNSYSGNGSTTVFAYTFKIFDDDDITVIIRTDSTGAETTQTKTTHYSVSGVGSASGGNITFGSAPASGETVVLLRTTARTQLTDYVANDPFPAATHEDALDKLTFLVQELEEEVGRAIKLSKTNEIATAEFTVGASDRANKILSFDASGDLTVTEGKVDTVTATASGLSAGATPTATATYTGSTGALAIAFGIPAGATGPTGPAGGGLADLSADTTPQLGGDLDMNGQDIVTTSNATIDLAPNGTGTVVVKGNTNPGTIVFNCESNSHGQTVKAQPHSAAVTNTLTLPPGGDGEIVSTVATQQLTNKVIPDDQNLSFGTDSDAFIKYDETTTDHLKIGGAVTTFEKAAVGATDTDTTNTGNVTLDFDASQNFVLTLTGNVTLVNPNTENVGQSGFIVFIQDATGGRTVSTSTDYETAGGAGLTLSSAASTTDIVPYVVAAGNRILLGAPQLAFA